MIKKRISNVFNKAAAGVAKAAGGEKLVDYIGTKIAQKKNPTLSIPQTTSGKEAAISGAKVAGTIASLAAGGGMARSLVKRAPKTLSKTFKIPGNKPIKISRGGRGGEVPLRKTWDEGGW